jgi:hypothetical protein
VYILVGENEPTLKSVPYMPSPVYSQSYTYAYATNKLLENIQQPTTKPASNMLLSTFDVDQGNIKSWAILDSGASSYFLCLDAPVTNKQIAKKTITVLQPDRDTMSSTHEGDLNLPQLPRAARRCHIILAIKHSLIYVVKLCEAGCEVKFIKWGVGI